VLSSTSRFPRTVLSRASSAYAAFLTFLSLSLAASTSAFSMEEGFASSSSLDQCYAAGRWRTISGRRLF
jgi:hypothetical protein